MRGKRTYLDEGITIMDRIRTAVRIAATAACALFLRDSVPAQAVQYPTARVYVQPGTEPPEHPIDITHMKIEVSFTPEQRLVHGRVTHTFVPLRHAVDSIFFNAPGIRILSATLNNTPLPFRMTAAGVTVFPSSPLRWGSPDSITFSYEARPARGLYFVGWDDPTGKSRKQIWTQGQGIDNRNWIPCYDEQNDKMTTETIVTVDSAFKVLSNGTRLEIRNNGDGTATWHYRMLHPHSTYLVMLGVGIYDVTTVTTRGGVPVSLWYYPEYPDRVEPTYRYAAACVDFVAEHTGIPYPWESYANIPVQDFLYGAMENTTATVFGDFFMVDQRSFFDRNYIAVDAHELTHQWFGDFITGRSGKSAWLQESFATFYPKLFQRSLYGQEWYEWERRSEQNAALAASASNRLPILHGASGSTRVYQKGSAVLDMMMTAFGEEECRRVITHYLRAHAYGNVETNDLYQAFQDVLGLSPDWFFEEWIYRGGEPEYRVSFEECARPGARGRTSIFTVRQVHERDELVGLFRMPITFEVHYAEGPPDRVTRMIADETERIEIPNPSSRSVAFALFDPGGSILKKVDFPQPDAALTARARHAPHMIDRYDAIVAMRGWPPAAKRDLLRTVFATEHSHGIRAEALTQLLGDPDPGSLALVRSALHDASAPVRAAVIAHEGTIPVALKEDYESLLRDSSYNTVAAALTALTDRFPKDTDRYLAITAGDRGIGNHVNVLWHEIRARRGERESVAQLVAYASPAYEFRTRINAIEALRRLNYCGADFVPHLFSALTHWNARLRAPAGKVAAGFLEQSEDAARLNAYFRTRSWSDAEREFLAPYFK
jgi:aminopeptidase N